MFVLAVATLTFPVAVSAEELDVELNPELDYLIIVNDEHPYEFGGAFDLALTLAYTPDAYGEATLVETATYDAFRLLQADLLKKGMVVRLLSGYRTAEAQQWLIDYYKENPVPWRVFDVGCSGHHTGLELSVMIWYYGEEDENWLFFTETEERQQTIGFFQLLHETMPDYGFIDRFPAGKEEWTGAPCEPFEIRFVGSPEIAHEIMDNGLCLEEYLTDR